MNIADLPYEANKKAPIISSRIPPATINKFKIILPMYSSALEENVARSTQGLIGWLLYEELLSSSGNGNRRNHGIVCTATATSPTNSRGDLAIGDEPHVAMCLGMHI
jgi:hypothetical protein